MSFVRKMGFGNLWTWALFALFAILFSQRSFAGETVIDIFGPSVPRFPICVFPFVIEGGASGAASLNQDAFNLLLKDLNLSGFFKIIDHSQALADPFRAGLAVREVDWRVLRLLGADIVIGGRMNFDGKWLRWEARVYDQPRARMIFGKAYRGRPGDLHAMVHRFVDAIIQHYTGSPGIFQTRIAFLSKQGDAKEIQLMDADGSNPAPVTKNRSINLSPQWSPDGREIAYISYKGPNAFLYLHDLDTGKRRVLSARDNMNGPASWAPDGDRLALTLTIHGNPELYIVDRKGAILRRLTHHPGIDVSPTWSPDGRSLAFVSNRSGGPQIYIMSLASGDVRRLTYEGNYNTNPAWSPRGDRIAYSALLDGNYEICSIRPDGTDPVILTDSPANDESPSWSPDGRYLAFSSTRTGRAQIFIMLFNGQNQSQISRLPGEQTSPAWSPWPAKGK